MNLSRKILLTFSILIALLGLVWFGQGIGMIHGSMMTDDRKWAVIGAIMIVAGIGTFLFANKRK